MDQLYYIDLFQQCFNKIVKNQNISKEWLKVVEPSLTIKQRVALIHFYFTNEKDVNKTITLWKQRFGQHLDLKPKTVEKFVRWFETTGSVRDEDNIKKEECGEYKMSVSPIKPRNMCGDNNTALIIDNGSGICKAGFAPNNGPIMSFPSMVGHLQHQGFMVPKKSRLSYVGDEANSLRGDLSLNYPIERGIVKDWNKMKEIWDHIYKELKVDPEVYPVLMTEPPLNPKSNREKLAEIMYESLKIPSMYVTVPAVLSLLASGRNTGIVLDCGEGVSHVVPIYKGNIKRHAICRQNLAGYDLTRYLTKLLTEEGFYYDSKAKRETVKDIKQELCYVAIDYEHEKTKPISTLRKSCQLLDGTVITIDSQRYRCPEALFQPSLLGLGLFGIHEMVFNSIMDCENEIRRDLYQSIVLSGGTTNLHGFVERIDREMRAMMPSTIETKFIVEAKNSVWMGGSIFAQNSLQDSQDSTVWVSKQEYEENGPSIVHKKWFNSIL